MLIDWFTVCAQIVNFLILVWLLKRYLYKPILSAIDERENRIKSELTKADAVKTQAQKEQAEFQKKNLDFDQQRTELFAKVETEAKTEKQKLLDSARVESESLRSKRKEALQVELSNFNKDITLKAQAEVFAVARKALSDLASMKLEEQIVQVFIQRLNALNPEEKKRFNTQGAATVRSAYELPEAERTAVENAAKAAIRPDIKIQFETAQNLISGIELTVDGFKLGWTISDYLKTMEQNIAQSPKINEAGDKHAP